MQHLDVRLRTATKFQDADLMSPVNILEPKGKMNAKGLLQQSNELSMNFKRQKKVKEELMTLNTHTAYLTRHCMVDEESVGVQNIFKQKLRKT